MVGNHEVIDFATEAKASFVILQQVDLVAG